MIKKLFLLLILTAPFFLASCHSTEKKVKIAASSVPHAEILEHIKNDLKKEGISLVIVEVDDYALPNRLLNERVIDANFFQHIPYLESEKQNFGYDFTWIAKVHIEPLSLYSLTISQLDQLPERAVIAIPNDPSNETRALILLQKLGFIRLKNGGEGDFLTILDIEENRKNLKIEELDAALLSHILPDVDGAIIPGNYAMRKQFDKAHILAQESNKSVYANVFVIRTSEIHREELRRIAELLNSEEMREYIKQKYQGKLIPAF